MFLNLCDRIHGGATGGKHRIGYDNDSLINRIRKLAVILMWNARLLIPVHTDVSNLCRWYEGKHARHHAKASTKYRNDSELTSGNHRSHTFLDWSLNLHIMQWQVTKCFKSFKHRNLLYELPELIGSRILVTQNRNLMLNQRMLKNRNVFLILKIHFVISFFLVFCFCYYIYSLDFTKTPRLWSPSGFTPNW